MTVCKRKCTDGNDKERNKKTTGSLAFIERQIKITLRFFSYTNQNNSHSENKQVLART